jgi:hypothetical protein
MQRLYKDSYGMESEYGITTFLVGNYTLYAMGPKYKDVSRLDKEFFFKPDPKDGFMIRGLPGCKEFGMCSKPNDFIGRFALSTSAIQLFELKDNIACDPSDNLARCD